MKKEGGGTNGLPYIIIAAILNSAQITSLIRIELRKTIWENQKKVRHKYNEGKTFCLIM